MGRKGKGGATRPAWLEGSGPLRLSCCKFIPDPLLVCLVRHGGGRPDKMPLVYSFIFLRDVCTFIRKRMYREKEIHSPGDLIGQS